MSKYHKIKKRKNKKTKKEPRITKQGWMALIFGGLLLASIFGYTFGSSSGSGNKYNGYKFSTDGNVWYVKIDGNRHMFYFHPLELSDINFTSNNLNNKKYFYLTFKKSEEQEYIDPIDQLRLHIKEELSMEGIYISDGIVEENEDYNLPLIDCINATETTPVIKILQSKEESGIFSENNCYVIKGRSGQELVALTDKLLYKILGVE